MLPFITLKFSLPSITTLRQTMKLVNMRPGFHPHIFASLKEKAASFTREESLVVIAFDEISIKAALNFDERKDNVVGYEDLDDNSYSSSIATYATVFYD